MKKMYRVLLPLLLIVINTGWAQSSRLESGVVFGGGFRWSDGNVPSQNAFCPLAGISLLYKFTDTFGFSTGMEYQLKGNKWGSSDYYINLHYISFPVRLTMMTGQKTNIYFHGGVYLAYLLQGIETYRRYNSTDYYKRFDTGYCLEPGIAVPLSKNYKFTAGIRYSQGVINISKKTFRSILTNSAVIVLGFSAAQ